MKNSGKPIELIATFEYARAYKQGASYYAEGMIGDRTAGRQRCKDAAWAKQAAQEQSDSLARIMKNKLA